MCSSRFSHLTSFSFLASGGMPSTMTSTPSSSQIQQQQAQQQQQPTQQAQQPQQQQQQQPIPSTGVPGGPGFGPGGPSAGPGAPSLQQQQQQNAPTPQQTMSNTVQADKSESSNPTTGTKLGYLIRVPLELEVKIRLLTNYTNTTNLVSDDTKHFLNYHFFDLNLDI